MREKITRLIALTTNGGLNASIGDKVNQLRDQWRQLFQEAKLSPGIEEAFNVLESAMRESQSALEDAVVATYERLFTEEEVDAAITHYSSPITRRLAEIGPKLMEEILAAEDAWLKTILRERNVDLSQLLGGAPVEAAPAAPMEDLTPEEPPSAA